MSWALMDRSDAVMACVQELEDVDVKFRYAHQLVEDQLRNLNLDNGKAPRLVHRSKAAAFYNRCREVRVQCKMSYLICFSCLR